MKAFFTGFLLALGFTVATFSMQSWQPQALHALESLGNFRLKPWVYFAPALAALVLVALAVPRFRNAKAMALLLAGGLTAAVAGGGGLLLLAMAAMPNMRY